MKSSPSQPHSQPHSQSLAQSVAQAVAPTVRLVDVGLRYGHGDEVLRDVSFTLPQGSFHFLTGPSGAGKTTLLKLMYLALQPGRGRLSLFGEDVTHPNRSRTPALRRRIGVIFQDFRLIDHLSVVDNVALPLRIAGLRPDVYRDDLHELLKWVGLGERLDAYPTTLSGGEKQRVAIARAVISKPDLLIADEPTGNVDPDMGDRLINLLLQLNRQGATVVVATHDRDLVHALSAPVLNIQAGRVSRQKHETGVDA